MFEEDTVRGYKRKNKPFVLRCPPEEERPLKGSEVEDVPRLVLSAVQARRLSRKGCQSFLAIVTDLSTDPNVSIPSPNSPVVDILSEFQDVFPEDVPHLPPERQGVRHTIPLSDPHARPPSRPLYRLSR
jgi:hypothetical protein